MQRRSVGVCALALGAAMVGVLGVDQSNASAINYYYDANGRLVDTTRYVGIGEAYAFDNADNRSTFNTGHQNSPTTPGQIQQTQQLLRYQSLLSSDGRFALTVQGDGNVVLYQGGTGLWSTSTVGKQSATFNMQTDGNLVLRDAYGANIWSSGTSGNPGAVLNVRTDGNMTITYNGGTIWQTNTCCH